MADMSDMVEWQDYGYCVEKWWIDELLERNISILT